MAFFGRPQKKPSEEVAAIMAAIAQHNQEDPKHKIQFLHGGSSAPFAFIGKKVNVYRFKTGRTEGTVIPAALIPTGFLRKRYGVYPISGELGPGVIGYRGHRKAGINNYALSGMEPDQMGVEITFRYAKNAKFFRDIDKLHKNIEQTILKISPTDYIRNLKLLVMYTTNIMLMDPENKEAARKYQALLDHELQNLRKRFQHNVSASANIERYINKYQPQINDILSGKNLPIISDDKFRHEILHQFPVIYASTVPGRGYREGVEEENIYDEEVSFDTVKIMFTPHQFAEQLKNKLIELKLDHIKVQGFEMKIEQPLETDDRRISYFNRPPTSEEKLKSTAAFSNATSVNELIDLTRENPDLMKGNSFYSILQDKIFALANEYIKEGNPELVNMIVWIIKNINSYLMQNVPATLEEFNQQYLLLAPKVEVEQDYLKNIPGGSEREFSHLKIMPYLTSLAYVCRKAGDKKAILDFTDKTESEFNTLVDFTLTGNSKEIQAHDLNKKIGFLEHLYNVFCEENIRHPQHSATITQQIEFIKTAYVVNLIEILKANLHNARESNPRATMTEILNDLDSINSNLFSTVREVVEKRVNELEKTLEVPKNNSAFFFHVEYDSSGDEIYNPDSGTQLDKSVRSPSTQSTSSNVTKEDAPKIEENKNTFNLPPPPPRR